MNTHTHHTSEMLFAASLLIKPRTLQAYKDASQTTFTFTFKSYPKENILKTTIINFIRYAFFSGNIRSKLMHILRNNLGLVYSISSTNLAYKYVGILNLEIAASPKNLKDIMKHVLDIFYAISFKGLSDKELAFFKTSFLNNAQLLMVNEITRTSWYAENVFYGVKLSEHEYFDIIKSITNKNIMTVGKEVFDINNMGVFSYGRINFS
jgi:predicted Zn-dependent peptidase